MKSKKIILNADDFGGSDFIDNGIIRGIKEGVVNSVSVLVNFNDSEERLKKNLLPLKEKYDFEIGLHLSFTSGYADADKNYKTLTIQNSKEFPYISNVRIGIMDKNEVITEITNQIEKLGKMIGGLEKIDHINHHHGIFYMHSYLFECFLEVIDAYKEKGFHFKLRSPKPWSKSGLIYYKYSLILPTKKKAGSNALNLALTKFGKGRFKTLIAILGGSQLDYIKHVQRELESRNCLNTFCFVDQYYGQAKKHNLKKIIEHTPEDGRIIEMMLHLGDKNTERDYASGITPSYYSGRAKELEVLIKNKALLNEVEKVNFSSV